MFLESDSENPFHTDSLYFQDNISKVVRYFLWDCFFDELKNQENLGKGSSQIFKRVIHFISLQEFVVVLLTCFGLFFFYWCVFVCLFVDGFCLVDWLGWFVFFPVKLKLTWFSLFLSKVMGKKNSSIIHYLVHSSTAADQSTKQRYSSCLKNC